MLSCPLRKHPSSPRVFLPLVNAPRPVQCYVGAWGLRDIPHMFNASKVYVRVPRISLWNRKDLRFQVERIYEEFEERAYSACLGKER